MNARTRNALNVAGTGFVVLLLMSMVLFWSRWGCEAARHALLPDVARKVAVDTSGFIPRDAWHRPASLRATMAGEKAGAEALGLIHYWNTHRLDGPQSLIYSWAAAMEGPRSYFDSSIGKIVYSSVVEVSHPDGIVTREKAVAYAGPDGIAESPHAKLGRFRDPIVRAVSSSLNRAWIVYDRKLRRFFAVDWRGATVRQGPALQDDAASPVDLFWIRKEAECIHVDIGDFPGYWSSTHEDQTLVLDAAGTLRILELNTLEYTSIVGRLPAPATLFPSDRHVTPNDLFAYVVYPDSLGHGKRYDGCAVAVLSRDATAMRLEVFDANGASVAMANSLVDVPWVGGAPNRRRGSISTGVALYLGLPGAPALTAVKFVLESLHPPALLLASYFTASSVEATAGHRSLFVLPNSFVAMKGRDARYGPVGRFWTTLPFLLPGILLGVALGASLAGNARRAGLRARTKRLWIVATVLLGLPAYITYWITRPKMARVTCQNCGRWRWVNCETCHHCGSPWLVPELVPPAWRVIGPPEEQPCNDPSPQPERTISGKSEV